MVNNIKKASVYPLILVPIIIWWVVIFKYVVDIPWFDDFDPFVDFLRKWNVTETAIEKVSLIFQPNNEHRMIFGKIPTIIYYYLTGTVNFVFLQVIGNCFGLGICYFLWKAFLKSKLDIWFFAPIPFLLFQFQDYLIFLWSICNLQHHPVMFFVVASMFFLAGGSLSIAMMLAFLATFSMGNGMFVWFAGAAVLLFQQQYKNLGIWSVFGVFNIVLYLFGIKPQGNEDSIAFLINNPVASLQGFSTFLGGIFDLFPWWSIDDRIVLPMILGTILVLGILFLTYGVFLGISKKKLAGYDKISNWIQLEKLNGEKNNEFVSFLIGVLVFILLNAIIIGLLRMRFGFLVMLVSNYKLYAAVFLIVCYLLFLSVAKPSGQKIVAKSFLALSIFIWLFTIYSYIPNISERRNMMIANAYNQNMNGMGLGHVPFSESAEYVDQLMKEMVKSGIYTYPKETKELGNLVDSFVGKEGQDFKAEVSSAGDQIIWTDPEYVFSMGAQDGVYIYLKSGTKSYIFRAAQYTYSGKNFLKQYGKGASFTIAPEFLERGVYQNGLVRISDHKIQHTKLKDIVIK